MTTTPLPPSRISHRAAGGPDLAYLYAVDRDGDDDDGDAQNHRESTRRPVRRGRASDARTLRGTTLYLGGEEGPNSKIYCIPGHASRVLCVDTTTDEVYPVGPEFDATNTILDGKFKWLRGICIGDIIYGLPCHADKVLRIDTRTDGVSTIDIPYEEYFDDKPRADGPIADGDGGLGGSKPSLAREERHRPWKYHGGAVSPHDGCIYAIPQSAKKVLRIDPVTETCSFVGPDLEGRCKWYGGVVGKTDGAIYGIPQNAGAVLRIDASGVTYDGEVEHDNNGLPPSSPEARVLVTTHGSYPEGVHNWHGAAASADGTIVSIPNNVDTVLCIVPAPEAAYPSSGVRTNNTPEPELYILEGEHPGDIATGRHRDDGKYKYLGAMAGTDGHVYCFPSGSERVLQVDTRRRIARSVGPNLRDAGMEALFQNKWQNGLTTHREGCVYAIPLGARTVLRIRTGPGAPASGATTASERDVDEPEVTTWELPQPNRTLEKWEGGVLASNGAMYCMPNNHKAVLQIVPPCVPSREALHRTNDEREEARRRARELQKQERRREMEEKKAEKERKRQLRLARRKAEKAGGREATSALAEEKKADEPTDQKSASTRTGAEEKKADELTNQKSASTRTVVEEKKEDESTNRKSASTQTAEAILNDDQFTSDGVPFKYRSGIPTLRSSAHRVKYSRKARKHDPDPKGADGKSTNTTFLPPELCKENILSFSTKEYDFHGAVVDMLQRCDKTLVGTFRSLADGSSATPKLDNFVVPQALLKRKCQKGSTEKAQRYLSDRVSSDAPFLSLFDRFVEERVLPHVKARLQAAGARRADEPISFYYQRPPTLRIQPGPARALVRAHNDAEYGHQNGELNFWLPLTSPSKTGVDLWVESKSDLGDYHPLRSEYGEVASFHGSSCRHYVNPNHSLWTRVSLDFRVGVEGWFDPEWQMLGTSNDHARRKVTL